MTARHLKVFLAAVLILAACFVVAGWNRVYRGPMIEPAQWDPKTDRTRIVAEARKLKGLWYDPLQGYFNDAGGKLGMIVCMDVPRLAYRNAGTSLKKLLENDYKGHPEHYGKRDGRPGDPYFDRRARNLYSFCKHNGCLHLSGPPEPGDVVFMGHSRVGWITHIALVTDVQMDKFSVVEASRDEWYVTREEDAATMFKRGWVFRGFGRPLKAAAFSPKIPDVSAAGFVGDWTSSNPASRRMSKVALAQDGSYEGACLEGKKVVCEIQGKWSVRRNVLVWVYPGAPDGEDPNPIIEFSKDRFRIREMDGSVTTFTRAGKG